MLNLTSIIDAAIFSVPALLIAYLAWREQRKQTRVMTAQVEKVVEIKLTRDLGDDDTAPRSAIDSTLRNYMSSRLSKVRTDLRNEFNQRLLELALGDASKEAMRVLNRQADAVEKFEASTTRVDMLVRENEALRRAIADIQNGNGTPAMVRAQIRRIAELLLGLTSEVQASDDWTALDTPSTTDAQPITDTLSFTDAPPISEFPPFTDTP